MTPTPSRRLRLLASTTAAATALLLTACGGSDNPTDPSPSPTASVEASDPPTQVTADEYCDEFLNFVDASAEFSATLDAPSGEALVEAARTMFELPSPIEMTGPARAAMDQLVEGTLAQLTTVPEVSVDTAPDPQYDAEPDSTELDLYLQDTCPA